MEPRRFAVAAVAALLVGGLPVVAAHGHETEVMGAEGSNVNVAVEETKPQSYFSFGQYPGWIGAHIALMILAWIIVMPVAVALSTARSRYHLPAQLLFHLVNGLGVFTGFIYNHTTPDLYKNNSHHPIGWVVNSFAVVWTLTSLYTAYSEYRFKRRTSSGLPLAAQLQQEQEYSDQYPGRWSRDSALGHSRQNSSDSVHQKEDGTEDVPLGDGHTDDDYDDEAPGKRVFLGNNRVDRFVSRFVERLSTPHTSHFVRFSQIFLEKILFLLGFLALSTGCVVYGGIFRDQQIFSGLAHFIKGGIFFFYGLLTLGRWMGAFTEFGWAWNIRPSYPLVARWKTRIPSAEFTESFVIWAYGASNVFLEHLGGWGKEWSPTDLEHVSITILFFGGGLLGMLIEAPWVRKFMNMTVVMQKSRDEELRRLASASRFVGLADGAADKPATGQVWEEPETYHFPFNPMPAVVIMALGLMMGMHHQDSMVSTMMHSLWGSLFTFFALARAVTYITLWIKPSTSHYAARPPSELVAAYCLTFGGLMFMMSAHDTVSAIEAFGLDAMTIFTITAGLSALVLAWEIVCFAVKGWAVGRERVAAGKALP